jgi:hypothetical protein
MAVALYSAAISLDPSSESLFANRSKVNLERGLYAEALDDAEKVRVIFIIVIAIVLILPMCRSLNSTLRHILVTK